MDGLCGTGRAPAMVLQAMRAVLSDDHNHERGLGCLDDLVNRIVQEGDASGIRDFVVALSLALAAALEQVADEQTLAAEDLLEVWFAE